MHPDCPDFDLCEACEAHPIAVHPDNHPLLKMKSIETVIPTVYRVGQTKLINGLVENPVTISDPVTTSQAPQHSVSAATPLKQVQMRNPSLVTSPPILPTSPFSGPDGSHALNNPVSLVDPQSPIYQAHTFPSLFPPSPPPQMIQVAPSVSKFMWGYRIDESDDFRHSPERFRSKEKEEVSGKTLVTDSLPDARSVWPVLSPSLIAAEPSDFANVTQAPLDSRNIWPNASCELNHLLQDVRSLSVSESATSFTSEPAKVSDASPLREEALLNRPNPANGQTSSAPHSLAALLNDYLPGPSPSIAQEAERASLSATFVADITVPDGQIFPPGAEFVKCWRVLNDGGCDWPETTELVFVAGDALVIDKQSQVSTIGSVKAGTEADLWTGELKAPDVAGRYVGYWRLRDEKGNLFGNSIWIEQVAFDIFC
jgi:next-to-BRCA1 protein 1